MERKECNTCAQCKILSEFSKAKSNTDGYSNRCKKCVSQRNMEYYRTEMGLIKRIYSNLKVKSRERNHDLPDFTYEELVTWIYIQNFKTIFKNWVDNNYIKDLIPSIDRLDSTIPYTLSNIRLVTWKINNEAAYSERVEGRRLTRQNRPVQQITEEGTFIHEYPSISKAARDNNFCRTNINPCLKGIRPLAHGFRWEYGNNSVPDIPTSRDK